jgi:hypothetical protein
VQEKGFRGFAKTETDCEVRNRLKRNPINKKTLDRAIGDVMDIGVGHYPCAVDDRWWALHGGSGA